LIPYALPTSLNDKILKKEDLNRGGNPFSYDDEGGSDDDGEDYNSDDNTEIMPSSKEVYMYMYVSLCTYMYLYIHTYI
jgi:hypothetical protein